ncbi:hypothetical protein BCU83_04210 [Vibrio breoganii]|uniref:hypothetical protein n=1 Tax=Vibrio breoganii TaxID=553239 RepID=UPI000C826CF9|nr:hypothetical protein [Vibrio breoganii]PMG86421.1 hypothetical protein BCU83_04210 [Vibrio breoganii]
MIVKDEEQLAEALQRGDSEIHIEGDLVNGVTSIRATGAVVWGLVIVAIVSCIGCTLVTRNPTAGVTVASLIGTKPALTAMSLVWIAGGVSVLEQLRSYRSEGTKDGSLVLKNR